MFGLSIEKIVVIVVIAAVIIGPQRLPKYAAKLAQLVQTIRRMADSAKDRMTAEMGPEFQDMDWKKLDPRQYDPRRIIRTALIDDEPRVNPAPGEPGHNPWIPAAASTESEEEPFSLESVPADSVQAETIPSEKSKPLA